MPDFLRQVSAFGAFLGIAGIGFVFLLISLIFGELFDLAGGDLDHDFDHGGPSFLSSRVLSVFVTAFGGAGAIATTYGVAVMPSSAIGFASGLVFATMIYWFARFLYSQQVTTAVAGQDLIGRQARVVVSIPSGGVGQVRVQVGEEVIDKVARSASTDAISANTPVVIEQSLGEIVVVRPVTA